MFQELDLSLVRSLEASMDLVPESLHGPGLEYIRSMNPRFSGSMLLPAVGWGEAVTVRFLDAGTINLSACAMLKICFLKKCLSPKSMKTSRDLTNERSSS